MVEVASSTRTVIIQPAPADTTSTAL